MKNPLKRLLVLPRGLSKQYHQDECAKLQPFCSSFYREMHNNLHRLLLELAKQGFLTEGGLERSVQSLVDEKINQVKIMFECFKNPQMVIYDLGEENFRLATTNFKMRPKSSFFSKNSQEYITSLEVPYFFCPYSHEIKSKND